MKTKSAVLALVLASCAAAALAIWPRSPTAPLQSGPQTTPIAAGEITYRPIGSFQQGGKTVTPPARSVAVPAFAIMTHEVSGGEYAACVAAGDCAPAGAVGGVSMPQTNVNWKDATAYAAWLSRATGTPWRLPTAEEWQRAAAEQFGDEAPEDTVLDPGQRMLAQYQQGVLLRGRVSYALRPVGGFGKNSLGVADMGGNVWEWTDGCIENGTLAHNGRVTGAAPYCGVRIAGGVHRAAIIDFVRDASVGGCAVGLPPDYLGFRLVRGG